jgi:hypothetical protein
MPRPGGQPRGDTMYQPLADVLTAQEGTTVGTVHEGGQ